MYMLRQKCWNMRAQWINDWEERRAWRAPRSLLSKFAWYAQWWTETLPQTGRQWLTYEVVPDLNKCCSGRQWVVKGIASGSLSTDSETGGAGDGAEALSSVAKVRGVGAERGQWKRGKQWEAGSSVTLRSCMITWWIFFLWATQGSFGNLTKYFQKSCTHFEEAEDPY